MELVYLWVEEYKNIVKQGFNFKKNKMFPKDLNLMAIVGENGSGKSGFIEALMLSLFNKKTEDFKYKFYLKFENEIDKYIYFTNNWNEEEKKCICDKEEMTGKNLINELPSEYNPKILHYNYSIDSFSSSFNIDCSYKGIYSSTNSFNIFSQPEKYGSHIDIEKINIQNQQVMTQVTYNYEVEVREILLSLFNKNNVNFVPTEFKLDFNIETYFFQFNDNRLKDSLRKYFYNQNITERLSISSLLKYSKVYIIFRLYELRTYEKNEHDYLEKIMSYLIDKEIGGNKEEILFDDYTINEVLEMLNSDWNKSLSFKKEFKDINNVKWYIDYIESNMKQSVNLFHRRSSFNFKILELLLQNLPSFIEINYWNELDISFKELSYGEKIINRLFYNLYYFISIYTDPYTKFIIIFDEIEVGLHPEWQRKLVFLLSQILEKLINHFDIKIDVIIATHSPFLLSDISNENIIFLNKYKEEDEEVNQKIGNCKVLKDGINEKTFGANIHTLLSNGFFMDQGLIGKFAKEKIQKVINDITSNSSNLTGKRKKEIEYIIERIGEPILKKKIKSMYENLIFEEKNIDEKIEDLEEKLSRLRNAKNRS